MMKQFGQSVNVNKQKEYEYSRNVADGRRPEQKYQTKFERDMNKYQSPQHLRVLEPLNVKKKEYIKKFGSGVYNNEEWLANLLHKNSKM